MISSVSPSTASHSSVPSQGIWGWSQATQARRRPSGESAGAAKKSWPSASTRGPALPSVGTTTRLLTTRSCPVALPDADQVAAVGGHDGIGVAPGPFARRFGGDGHGWLARSQPVEALVGEVGEVGHAVVHHHAPPAVLVGQSPYPERFGDGVLHRPVGTSAYQHVAATLTRAALHPVDGVTVGRGRAQAHGIGDEEPGGDRRRPRAVGSGLRSHRPKLPQVPAGPSGAGTMSATTWPGTVGLNRRGRYPVHRVRRHLSRRAGEGDRAAQPNSMALYSASLCSGCRASMRRTVPDLDRMTSDWLVAPNSS